MILRFLEQYFYRCQRSLTMPCDKACLYLCQETWNCQVYLEETESIKMLIISGCLLLFNLVIIGQVLMVNELQKQFWILEIVDHGLSHKNWMFLSGLKHCMLRYEIMTVNSEFVTTSWEHFRLIQFPAKI